MSERAESAAASAVSPHVDNWQDVARSLAFWLDKHVDPPDGSKGCPDACEARRALARYRQAEADYFRQENADAD